MIISGRGLWGEGLVKRTEPVNEQLALVRVEGAHRFVLRPVSSSSDRPQASASAVSSLTFHLRSPESFMETVG